MKNTFETDGFKFSFDFVNEQLIHRIKLKNTLTSTTYEAKNVQLIRVKRDTIAAALGKKNPDAMSYQIKEISEGEKKYLSLSIEVHFDYLPKFDETIHLQQTAENPTIEDIQSEIDEINEIVDKVSADSSLKVTYKESCNMSISTSNVELCKKDLQKGEQIIQVTGVCRPQNGGTINDIIYFVILLPNGEKLEDSFKTGTNYSYGYPFSISKFVKLDDDGEVKIYAKNKDQYNPLYMERYEVVIVPVTTVCN